jgi:outer membrane protein W
MRHTLKRQFFNLTRVSLAVSAILLAQSAMAQDFIKGGQDKFTFNVGGVVSRLDTQVAIDGVTSSGTLLNNETAGLSSNTSNLAVSATWRFADRHRFDVLYFGTNRTGTYLTDRDITVGDVLISAGSSVTTEAKTNFYLADYRYSVYKTDAVEIGGVLGLYGLDLNYKVTGTQLLAGSVANVVSASASSTLPLPMLGVSGDWYVQPRWRVSSNLMGLSAKVGDIDGSVRVLQLGSDYMIARNWGVGLSYLHTKVNLNVTRTDFDGQLDWSNNSLLLYATVKY